MNTLTRTIRFVVFTLTEYARSGRLLIELLGTADDCGLVLAAIILIGNTVMPLAVYLRLVGGEYVP